MFYKKTVLISGMLHIVLCDWIDSLSWTKIQNTNRILFRSKALYQLHTIQVLHWYYSYFANKCKWCNFNNPLFIDYLVVICLIHQNGLSRDGSELQMPCILFSLLTNDVKWFWRTLIDGAILWANMRKHILFSRLPATNAICCRDGGSCDVEVEQYFGGRNRYVIHFWMRLI